VTALRNLAAIVEKEWRHYFGSPIAYVALFVWTMLFGIFFYFAFSFFLEQSMRMSAPGMKFGGGMRLSMNEYLIRPLLQNTAVVALFITPMLTMRLFAEEKRQGTIELLATSPLSDLEIVLGKFLAAAGLFLVMVLAGMVDLALIWASPYIFEGVSFNPPEWRPVLTGGLGVFLLGCSFIAMGTFVSTLTRNQIVAGILSFCLFLGMWTLGWAEDPMASPTMKAVAYLGVTTHLEDLVKGIVDLKDIVFYLSVIAFGIFLAHQSVESQRWRA